MGASQPFMYAANQRDPRFHEKPFDPKAVTRASRNPKPRKPQPAGPLVSFNQHPDSHVVFQPTTAHLASLGSRTKSLIKWLRRLQLGLRIVQLIAAVGVLFLFSIFKNVDDLTTWAVRIMQMVAIANCVYAIFSLSRRITARTAASTAAYQFFAIGVDFLSTVAYVLGVIVARAKSNDWATVLSNQRVMGDLVDAVYYTMIVASGLHFLIIPTSFWLGWTFRKISLMPPDANPLEDLLTSRPMHKRNKSSAASAVSHDDESSRRPWTQTDSRRNSTQQSPQPRTIAFMDTRVKARISTDGKLPPLNLPDRQYQIQHGRPSVESSSPTKSMYHKSFAGSSHKGTYMEVPVTEADSKPLEPQSHDGDRRRGDNPASPISMTSRCTTAVATGGQNRHQTRGSKSYAALTQHDNADDSPSDYSDYEDDFGAGRSGYDSGHRNSSHPNPLRSHPTSPDQVSGRISQALRPGVPAVALEYGSPRANQDDRDGASKAPGLQEPEQRQRNSSIQPEEFFSVTNGPARDSISPIPIGNVRKVSGNDYASSFSAIPQERQSATSKGFAKDFAGNKYM